MSEKHFQAFLEALKADLVLQEQIRLRPMLILWLPLRSKLAM